MSAEAPVEDGQVTESGEIWEGVVPGILRGLYVGRRTGTLTFERGGEHRGVHFRRGCIVNADTDVRDDRLGPVLQRAGRLSDADRKRAEGFALRDGRRLGSVLVEMGLLDRSGLEEALALHVDAVLSKVFAWPDGRYEFRQYAQLPLADEMTLRVSTGDVILQAAHSVTDPDVVRYNLGSLDRAAVAAVVKAYSFVTEPAASGLAALGRWGYMTAIILVFFLVAALFQRSRLLTKRGGLSLFALVEIATFLAAPGGQDVIGLTGKPDWMAIALALALAIVMGFAASEFILGLVAIAIAWISWSMDLVMGGASSVVSAGAGMAVLIAIIVVGVFG